MNTCTALSDCVRPVWAPGLYRGIGIATILLASVGCARTSMAAAERDAAAKSFATNGVQANVYVYRLSAAAGDVTYPVSLDGTPLGELAVGTFALAVATPGPHTVLVAGKREASPWADFAWLWGGEKWSLRLVVMTDMEEAMEEVRRCNLTQGTD